MYWRCLPDTNDLVTGADGLFRGRIEHRRRELSAFPPGRRISTRAVVWRGGELLLVHSARLGDFKFPGGGVEEGESPAMSLARELREEAGHVLTGEPRLLGEVEECWYDPGMTEPAYTLVSHYYQSSVSGEQLTLSLEDYEAELGFAPRWISPAEAVHIHQGLMRQPPPGLRSWIQRETMVLRWLQSPQGEVKR